jgi:hypothetical protein
MTEDITRTYNNHLFIDTGKAIAESIDIADTVHAEFGKVFCTPWSQPSGLGGAIEGHGRRTGAAEVKTTVATPSNLAVRLAAHRLDSDVPRTCRPSGAIWGCLMIPQPRPKKAGLDKDFPDPLEKPVDTPYGPYADGFSASSASTIRSRRPHRGDLFLRARKISRYANHPAVLLLALSSLLDEGRVLAQLDPILGGVHHCLLFELEQKQSSARRKYEGSRPRKGQGHDVAPNANAKNRAPGRIPYAHR